MTSHIYWLIVAVLAVWRLSRLIAVDTGPWQILARLRRKSNGTFAELFTCIDCVSLWLAAPIAFAIGESWKERLLLCAALSGGAILLESLADRISNRQAAIPEAIYFEDEENTNVLRKEQDTLRIEHRHSASR